MRLRRIQDLTLEMGQVLSGLRGGIIGIRFDTDSLGRGIGGEALANPIPHEKRVIGVGIGNWYRLAPEMKELFRTRAEEEIPAQKPLDIFGLDDFGQKISEETGEVIPWKRCPETHAERLQREPWYTEARTLRHALRTFTRYHQVMQIINTGGKPKVAASKPPKKLPAVLQAPADKEEEDEELELSDEEDDADASSFSLSRPPPVYSVRMQEDALEQLKQLSHDLIDEEEEFISFSEEEPPNFVLCHPDGTPLLGPRDENGEISLENMREVSVNLARTAVQRRFDLLCIAKRQELATIIASRGTRVDIPGRIVNK
jgi:hypothetical protein